MGGINGDGTKEKKPKNEKHNSEATESLTNEGKKDNCPECININLDQFTVTAPRWWPGVLGRAADLWYAQNITNSTYGNIGFNYTQIRTTNVYLSNSTEFVWDASGGAGDFVKTYFEMREANHLNSDKYFHAKANFLAASRGEGGTWMAIRLSNIRESLDMRWPKNDSYQQSIADQMANRFGRDQAQFYNRSNFLDALQKYRPNNLPAKY